MAICCATHYAGATLSLCVHASVCLQLCVCLYICLCVYVCVLVHGHLHSAGLSHGPLVQIQYGVWPQLVTYFQLYSI